MSRFYWANPKNPIIAAFFRNIGYADELGSGVRNLYYCVKRYSGTEPQLLDGDVFKIIVPLDENYSFDISSGEEFGEEFGDNETQHKILIVMRDNPKISAKAIAEQLNMTARAIEKGINALRNSGVIIREGSPKNGRWIIK